MKDRLNDWAPDALSNEEEELWEAHEARAYKYRAHAALNANLARKQESFNDAFARFLSKPQATAVSAPPQWDISKVLRSIAIQMTNITLLVFLIYLGYWPIGLVTTLAFLAGDYFQLKRERHE